MKRRNIRIAVVVSMLATMAMTSIASAHSLVNYAFETLGMRW